ncbi:MAG: type VI secretion system tip protein VgrG [Sandaracinaceae bacterium]|nr:type VI secretion system tip protein VgrG [Sandaracinaceae bacterium]
MTTDSDLTIECEVSIDGIPPGVLVPRDVSIREAVFECTRIDAVIESVRPVELEAMIGAHAEVRLVQSGEERSLHGVIVAATLDQPREDEESFLLTVEIRPRLYLLKLGRDHRIFKDKNLQEIVLEVLEGAGLSGDDVAWNANGDFPTRPHVVQYGESDYDFITRLLFADGVGFLIHHDLDQEVVQFFDDGSMFEPIDGPSQLTLVDEVGVGASTAVALSLRARVGSDQVMLRDYDPEKPAADLSCMNAIDDAVGLEQYVHPGGYLEMSPGEQRAERLLQRLRMRSRVATGRTINPLIGAGRWVELASPEGRGDRNDQWLVLEVEHRLRPHPTPIVETRFEAIPLAVDYRPQAAPSPPRTSMQLAFTTTSSPSEDIQCDDLGRVHAYFPWDRRDVRDHTASVGMRVGQLALPGSMLIPRNGFELVIHHELGDLDRPTVVSHLYNGEQRPPYALPEGMLRSSFQTGTTSQGGGANELRFEDTAGAEGILLNASKDWTVDVGDTSTTAVGVNETLEIGVNRSLSIGTAYTQNVEGARSVTVGANQKVNVGANLSESVGGDYTTTIGGMRMAMIGGDLLENTTGDCTRTIGAVQVHVGINGVGRTIGGSATTTVLGAWIEGVGQSRLVSAANFVETVGGVKMVKAKTVAITCGAGYVQTAAVHDVKCGGSRTDTASGLLSLAAAGGIKVKADNIVIGADSSLTVKAGGCSISLKSSGTVEITASGNLDLRGAKGINQAIHKSGP